MDKRRRFLVLSVCFAAALMGSVPELAGGISWGWNEHGNWLWYDDREVHSLGFALYGCYPHYQYVALYPDPQQFFVSLHPVDPLYYTANADQGGVTFYYSLRNATAADEGVRYTFRVGGCSGWMNPDFTILGVMAPGEAGPYSGPAAIATQRWGDVINDYLGGCPWCTYDWSWWSFGIFNIARQMTGGNVVGEGGPRAPAWYSPAFWSAEPELLVAELRADTFYQDVSLIEAAARSGKIIILPGAPFDVLRTRANVEARQFTHGEFTFEYAIIGDGAVVNGTQLEKRWDLNWAVAASPYGWGPNVFSPRPDRRALASALNHLVHGISSGSVLNHPPVADAGADQTLSADGRCQALATLSANMSWDPDGDPLTYQWQSALGESAEVVAPFLLSLGTHDFSLRVLDPMNLEATDTTRVTVVDSTAPIIVGAPPELMAECRAPIGTDVLLPAVSASDNCSSDVEVIIDKPALFPAGPTIVRYTAADAAGNVGLATTTVTVVDRTAPSVSAIEARPAILWPPNNKMVAVSIAVTSLDTCSGTAGRCHISGVTSNEPSDGSDWAITGPLTLDLRAKRLGSGQDRVYTISVECRDDAGNGRPTILTVRVPHDQR